MRTWTLHQEEQISRRTDIHPHPRGAESQYSTNRLTDPQRDRHRDISLSLWSILGWCFRALGELDESGRDCAGLTDAGPL